VTVAVTHRSQSEGTADLQRVLRCGVGGAGLEVATAAEHLRSALYGAAMLESNQHAGATVHTTRLLSNARRVLDLVMPSDLSAPSGRDQDEDRAAFALDALQQTGDAVDTGNGRWLGGPTRLFAVEGVRSLLLTGSLPHALAERVLGGPIFCAGVSRIVDAETTSRSRMDDVVTPMAARFGSETALAPWTDAILGEYAARLRDDDGSPADQLELYAPDVLRNQHRPGRWILANQVGGAIDGMRLYRPRTDGVQRYNRPHFLGTYESRHGSLVVRRYVRIAHELTLRLRFGLDQKLGTPRPVAITLDKQMFVIDRPPQLPEPEQRIYALGWEEHEGALQRHAFHIRVLPFVLHALQSLSITPITRAGAGT
jgi:hypothetical protein